MKERITNRRIRRRYPETFSRFLELGKKERWRVQLSHYNAKPPFRVESTKGKGSDTPASWLKVSKGGCSFLQSLQIAKDICQIHPADGANKQRRREKEEGGGGRIFCRCIWSPIQFFRIKDGWNEFTGRRGGGEYFLNDVQLMYIFANIPKIRSH